MSFFTQYLPDAKQASSQCKVLVSVILAQWADETGEGTSHAFNVENNYAGVSAGGGVNSFPTKAAGLAAYIKCLNQHIYDPVRQAVGWQAQAVALGVSPWAAARYDAADYNAHRPLSNPGIDLVNLIKENNLTQFDAGTPASASSPADTVTSTFDNSPAGTFAKAFPPAAQPPAGFDSDLAIGLLVLNGTSADALLGEALINAELDLSITQSSTLTLTIHDPDAKIVQLPEFSQASLLYFNPLVFQLYSVDKAASVLTCTFIPWSVAALKAATGAFTVAPGVTTRTDFARILATESANGISFVSADDGYLFSLDQGYAHDTKEQLSRGTIDAPLEDSWTCLQRLASEIQWVCFESFGTIYFGPYSYLTSLPPVLTPVQFTGGIGTIDGTYDVGQPLGDLTVNAVAGAWTPTIGQCVDITSLGPFNGTWLVSEMSRPALLEPDIVVTLQQPLPSLPEPSGGGSQPAVTSGAGDAQTAAGGSQAQRAVAYALSKKGDRYSEAGGARLGPNSFDCSGLVYEAYFSVGVQLAGTTTAGMWPNGAGPRVPAGIGNLLPGDLVFFGPPGQTPAETNGHVAMVVSVNTAKGTVEVIEAANPSQGVITDTFTPTIGAHYGSTLVYFGATRPAP